MRKNSSKKKKNNNVRSRSDQAAKADPYSTPKNKKTKPAVTLDFENMSPNLINKLKDDAKELEKIQFCNHNTVYTPNGSKQLITDTKRKRKFTEQRQVELHLPRRDGIKVSKLKYYQVKEQSNLDTAIINQAMSETLSQQPVEKIMDGPHYLTDSRKKQIPKRKLAGAASQNTVYHNQSAEDYLKEALTQWLTNEPDKIQKIYRLITKLADQKNNAVVTKEVSKLKSLTGQQQIQQSVKFFIKTAIHWEHKTGFSLAYLLGLSILKPTTNNEYLKKLDHWQTMSKLGEAFFIFNPNLDCWQGVLITNKPQPEIVNINSANHQEYYQTLQNSLKANASSLCKTKLYALLKNKPLFSNPVSIYNTQNKANLNTGNIRGNLSKNHWEGLLGKTLDDDNQVEAILLSNHATQLIDTAVGLWTEMLTTIIGKTTEEVFSYIVKFDSWRGEATERSWAASLFGKSISTIQNHQQQKNISVDPEQHHNQIIKTTIN